MHMQPFCSLGKFSILAVFCGTVDTHSWVVVGHSSEWIL